MTLFLVNHPQVVSNWVSAREEAIGRVVARRSACPSRVQRFHRLLQRTIVHVQRWRSDDAGQRKRIHSLDKELQALNRLCFPSNAPHRLKRHYPWRYVVEYAASHFGLETQELLNSLILEPYPELVDDLECDSLIDETSSLDVTMRLSELKDLIESAYAWALGIDYEQTKHCHYFWYRSRQKVEPRIGVRGKDPGDDRELVVGIGREVARLHDGLCAMNKADLAQTIPWLLLRYPCYRATVLRIHSLRQVPYAEVQANLLDASFRPVDLLRFKLSILGTIKYDPKSTLWLRITLLQGAPVAGELLDDSVDLDDWFCPIFEG